MAGGSVDKMKIIYLQPSHYSCLAIWKMTLLQTRGNRTQETGSKACFKHLLGSSWQLPLHGQGTVKKDPDTLITKMDDGVFVLCAADSWGGVLRKRED